MLTTEIRWAQYDGVAGFYEAMFQLGPLLLQADYYFDLRDLSAGTHAVGHVPATIARTCHLDGGTAIGVNIASELAFVATNGDVTIVDAVTPWERIIGNGNYCWAYGGSQLRRIDRATGAVDPSNWLGTFGLLQVTSMSLTLEDLVRLDGVDSTGGPVVVYVDSSSGELSSSTTELPRLHQVLPLGL